VIARGRPAVLIWSLALLFALLVHGCASVAGDPPGDEHGAIVLKKLPHGEYAQYLPRRAPKGMLVIVHGSVEEEGSDEADIRKLAEKFLQRWTRFADEHALIAVAPLFDHNFGSWIGEPGIALGGYRSLTGKEVGADEFVDGIVARYREQLRGEQRFYLYGHSAGGQFANRYAVRHPERLKALVLSAPGRYAFPDPQAPWPYGQKEVTVRTGPQGIPRTIRPDRDGWQRAAALPITVVVGSADTEPQPVRAAHAGTTRVGYAQQWTEAMTRLVPAGQSRIRLIVVPRVGHSSAGLTPACQRAMGKQIGE
jgi:pimeloyl-ACP methyl ester carboxylesterase